MLYIFLLFSSIYLYFLGFFHQSSLYLYTIASSIKTASHSSSFLLTQYSSICCTLKGQRTWPNHFIFAFLHSVPSWALISDVLPMQSERNKDKCDNIFMTRWTVPSCCCHLYLYQLSFYHLPALSWQGSRAVLCSKLFESAEVSFLFSALWQVMYMRLHVLTTAYFTSSELNDLTPGKPTFFYSLHSVFRLYCLIKWCLAHLNWRMYNSQLSVPTA